MQLRKNSVSSLSLILRCGAAGLLAVWGGDSGWVCGAFLESAVWVERRRGAEVHGADPGSRDWDGLFYCAVLWIGCGKIHESGSNERGSGSAGSAVVECVCICEEQSAGAGGSERDGLDRLLPGSPGGSGMQTAKPRDQLLGLQHVRQSADVVQPERPCLRMGPIQRNACRFDFFFEWRGLRRQSAVGNDHIFEWWF